MFRPRLPSRSGLSKIVGRLAGMQLRVMSKSTVVSPRLAVGLLMCSVGRPVQAVGSVRAGISEVLRLLG